MAYDPQGNSNWFWVDEITDPSTPEEADFADAISLGCGIRTSTAPQLQPTETDSTVLCNQVASTIPGLPTVTGATLELILAGRTDEEHFERETELRELLAEKTSGFLVHARRPVGEDLVPEDGDIVDVWPAEINTIGLGNTNRGQVATLNVSFTHNGAFHEGVVVGGIAS